MNRKNIGSKNLNLLILLFCFLSFSSLYSQIDVSKEIIDKNYPEKLLSSQKGGDYFEETKILTNKTDTITFLFDSQNISKLIIVKNKTEGISNGQFHKYASEIDPQFKFHSKQENKDKTVYFNEEKNLLNIKMFSDTTKSKLIQIIFVSGHKLIQNLILQ